MFVTSLEKTAFLAGALGKAKGLMGRGAKAVSEVAGAQKAKFTAGVRSGATGINREVGAGLATRKVKAMQEADKSIPVGELARAGEQKLKESKQAVYDRLNRKNRSNTPSFASRHPYMTAGAAAIGTHYALSGGKKEEQPPAVVYPNTGY